MLLLTRKPGEELVTDWQIATAIPSDIARHVRIGAAALLNEIADLRAADNHKLTEREIRDLSRA